MATNPTIKIAEDARPVRLERRISQAGGVYHTRRLSRSRSRTPFPDREHTSSDLRREVSENAEEGDDWRRDEGPKKQVFKGTTLLWLAYQSIGVIYGDIGTSPLYVFSSTFTDTPSPDDVLQVLSVIIWSITIMVTLKYIFIVLRADNDGEGGTFSCYSLLTRYLNIADRDPREHQLVRMERFSTQELTQSNRAMRSGLEKSKFMQRLLKFIGVLAVSMVIADGVLTPAQSVLGAIQGISVVNPDISQSTIVGTSCGILVLLFLIQPLGTSKLASAFAPIVILWLGFNAGFGIYNLVYYDHGVLRAFSPYFAIRFFMDNKTAGWRMLGGILLSFTGVEALFADLGAFSMQAIQLSWMCWCYPCLLLAYTGQAAYLSVNPDGYSNPFFNAVPPGMLYPSLIVAILAAIVASQAMITATFQLLSQMTKLSYCPQVKIVHTSRTFHGQLYVPFLNWLLLVGCILVTAVYSNTTRLGNAYGVCVIFVTFFDTCMVTLVALFVWRLPPYLVVLPWLFFATVDGLYLSSALTKVPEGAWLTLTIAGVLACLFLLWRFGKETQWTAEAEDHFHPSKLLAKGEQQRLSITPRFGGGAVTRVRGLGIYFDKTGVACPAVFTQFVLKFGAVPEVMIFFHLHPVETPSVPEAERYAITRLNSIPGCYRLVVRHGFMDEVISPDLALLIYEQVRAFITRRAASGFPVERRRGREGENEDEEKEDEEPKAVAVSSGVADGSAGVVKPTAAANRSTTTTREQGDSSEDFNTETNTTTTMDTNTQLPDDSKPATAETVSGEEKGQQQQEQQHDAAVALELDKIDGAFGDKVMYIVGKEQMKVRHYEGLGLRKGLVFRRGILELFLWIRENTRDKVSNLRLNMDRVVEVGFVKDI